MKDRGSYRGDWDKSGFKALFPVSEHHDGKVETSICFPALAIIFPLYLLSPALPSPSCSLHVKLTCKSKGLRKLMRVLRSPVHPCLLPLTLSIPTHYCDNPHFPHLIECAGQAQPQSPPSSHPPTHHFKPLFMYKFWSHHAPIFYQQ